MIKKYMGILAVVVALCGIMTVSASAAVTETSGDGYALVDGVRVPLAEVPEGADYISLEGMRVIEWDLDTTGLYNAVGTGATNYYKVLDIIPDVSVGDMCILVYQNSYGDLVTQNLAVTEEDYGIKCGLVRMVHNATAAYEYAGTYFRQSSASSNVLFAYHPIASDVEGSGIFLGFITSGFTSLLDWIGTVVDSLISPDGALYVLLPLFVVGIAIPVVFVGVKAIRFILF